MRVDVERHADLPVPEDLHDNMSRHALGEKNAGRRVSQVVKAYLAGPVRCRLTDRSGVPPCAHALGTGCRFTHFGALR